MDGNRGRCAVGATHGQLNGWNLQIIHANPTLKADPAPFKIKKKFAISAVCDANCTVTTGGKAQKKGKGVVTLTATDETGGTATTTVNAKTLKAKPKK